ncbi:hypothetical protein C0995_008272, partial [Termitomyces sp. Mi166
MFFASTKSTATAKAKTSAPSSVFSAVENSTKTSKAISTKEADGAANCKFIHLEREEPLS